MKLFDKGELKLLWPFYLEYLMASLIFLLPPFIVPYFHNLNFTFSQIGILLAITPLAMLLFEIPTGAVADLYGRKISVLIGYSLEGICMILLYFARNYYSILIILAIMGMAMTFSSGSKDAWVVDSINKRNKKLVHNFFNKLQIFINLGLIISGILGAFLVSKFGLGIIWPMTALSFLASIVILSIFAKEEYVTRKVKIRESLQDITKQSHKTLSYGYKHHVLFYYLLASFLLIIAVTINGRIAQTALLGGFGFPDSYFGYLWSLMAFFSMIAPMVSSQILKRGKERKFMMVCLAITAIIISFILLAQNWIFVLIILSGFTFFIDLRSPASDIYFHRFIPSKLRATMGSVKSMIASVGWIISSVIVGYLVDLMGAKYTILLYVPIAILIIFIYTRVKD